MAYIGVAIAFSWPLPLHLSTHLTGDPAGDTGIYVWNQWVFQHELLDRGRLPYFTDTIFASGSQANLSLHNYTTFQNLLALPLIRLVGVVAAFNIVLLLMRVITAYATFLLARRLAGRAPEAWLAGLLFAWSPLLVTRGSAHFSLVAAAPLAVFLLVLVRAHDQLAASGRIRPWTPWALGAALWWAASTDVYYAVYCLLIGAAYLVGRSLRLEPATGRSRRVRSLLAGAAGAVGVLAAAIAITGGWSFTLLDARVHMRTLFTPMLALTVLALAWAAYPYRLRFTATFADARQLARMTVIAGIAATVLLSPVLYAAALRLLDGRFEIPGMFWRSSPAGADLASIVMPNPNHPLMPAAIADWIAARPSGYAENVVSVPLVGLAILAAAWRLRWQPPRAWMALGTLFGLLALGPFVQLAGVNTHIPGPWALLRYVPVIGLARTPTRFGVVLVLAVAVLVASALVWLGRRYPARRGVLVTVTGLALAFELLPLPLPLYSAAVPGIYRHVAAAPADVRLLELPFGFRDGASSVGNATARSQFFQTTHGKSLQGGYLSRVSRQRIVDARRDEVLDVLLSLSEDQPLSAAQERTFLERGPAYVDRARLGFVVVDRSRASDRLRRLASQAFRLHLVETEGSFELYAPDPR